MPVSSLPWSDIDAYDPWRDVRQTWPEITVIELPMAGLLLGWVRYPVIALREGTSAAQRRCTLAHELVHLERGIRDCGPWAAREEQAVHDEVARRLVPVAALAAAIRDAGGSQDRGALAALLDVDQDTLQARLRLVTAAERRRIRTPGVRGLWAVA
jgi:hypothetical protein